MLLQPAIERSLRFLQQPCAVRKSGLLSGGERQLLSHGIERRRNGDNDLLSIEPEIRTRLAEARVPGRPQEIEDQRGSANRRDLSVARDVLRSPRQERRGAIGGMVTQPRLGRMGNPPRSLSRPLPREVPCDPLALAIIATLKLS